MAGHNMCSTVQRVKNVRDPKRGQIFDRLPEAPDLVARNSVGNSDAAPRPTRDFPAAGFLPRAVCKTMLWFE